MPPTTLNELIEQARKSTMTAQQKEEQRRSFVYGNTHIENDDVTKEIVDRAAANLSTDERTKK